MSETDRILFTDLNLTPRVKNDSVQDQTGWNGPNSDDGVVGGVEFG